MSSHNRTQNNRLLVTMDDAQYYMRVRGRVQGPFDQEKLQSFSRRGQLSRLHEVSTDGINWARASTFPELFVGPVTEPTTERAARPAPEPPPRAASPPASPPNSAIVDVLAPGRPEWWYSVQGKQQGPVEFGILQQLTAAGRLAREDFVWKSGMAGWCAAAEISGLTFGGIHPPGGDFQPPGDAALDERLCRTALRLRPFALLLAVTICLAAGSCCLWSLWQFFGTAAQRARVGPCVWVPAV